MSEENVHKFYEMYEEVLKEHNLIDKPWVIFNLDETGFNTDRVNLKVYVGKEVKNAYLLTPPGTKNMYTVLFCVSATGEYLPPYIIYRSKNLWNSWTRGGPEGACYSFNDSGWMMDINFENWFIDIFIKHTRNFDKPVLLTFDGHNSHLTYRTVKAAIDSNIIIICLPPNTSHALQPLDVSVFRGVKRNWKEIVNAWFRESRLKNVYKAVFPHLLSKLWGCLDPTHSINGFKHTGLYPLNKKAVDSRTLVSPSSPQPITSVTRCQTVFKKSILEVLYATPSADTAMAMENKTRKRTRMQTTYGEVLTSENSLKKLKAEEENRNKKNSAKIGVPITTNTKQSRNKRNVENMSGNGKVTQRKLVKKNSKENSDEKFKVNLKDLQEHITYVIVTYEGSYFPGLVLKIGKSKVTVKAMQKSGLFRWKWPTQDDLHDYSVNEIIQIIKTPSVSNKHGHYYVPDVDKYWKI